MRIGETGIKRRNGPRKESVTKEKSRPKDGHRRRRRNLKRRENNKNNTRKIQINKIIESKKKTNIKGEK